MPCEEYKKLIMFHEWATHRVSIYQKPERESKLRRTDFLTLYERLETAKAGEREIRRQMEAHVESCQICRGITLGGDER